MATVQLSKLTICSNHLSMNSPLQAAPAPNFRQLDETVLSSIADFIYIFDHDGRFLYANKSLLHLWGLELIDVVGKTFSDLQYPEALAAKLQQQIQQVFETKQPLSDKTHYTSPTGTSGFYEYIFAPVLAADDSVEFVSGSTRNLTELHHTLDALRLSEERLRRVVEASGRGTWELEADTGRVTGDAQFFTLMGLPCGIPLTTASPGALGEADMSHGCATATTIVIK